MKFTDRIQNAFQAFTKNSMTVPLGRQFFKYGNRKPLMPEWSTVMMSDEDMYKGYPYAVVRKRSKRVARLGIDNVKTKADDGEQVTHPYLDIIDSSSEFSNYAFWYTISTYLDIKGVFYIMAVRSVDGERVGNVQEFKLLNPYNIKRVIDKDTGEVEGYIETQDEYQLVREIPKEMIIEIRELNPFSDDKPISMIDAAKGSQYILNQSGDYTRHAIKNNMNAPGIIGTDVLLPDEEFENFRNRVLSQEKGAPLFGNGSGAITYQNMQTDMDKAALDKINEINRTELFAVGGVSKTTMGIEQSGVTRDSSRAQTELFISDEVVPRLQDILDALNQDYKNYYNDAYIKQHIHMYIDSPLGVDREAEKLDVAIRKDQYALYTELINAGYNKDEAAEYANGELALGDLTEPKVEKPQEVVIVEDIVEEQSYKKKPKKKKKTKQHVHEHIEVIHNQLDEEGTGIVTQQQGTLQTAIRNIEEEVVATVINKVTTVKNAFETEEEIITTTQRNRYERDLELALAAFYALVIPMYATTVLNRRAKEYGKLATFKMNNEVKGYIRDVANKAAASHMHTILNDILVTTQQAALQGASQEQLVSMIKQKYTGTIATTRAKTIARTETNRAFTQSQYQADRQFLKQNKLTANAYKKWITRSDNPCPLCVEMAAQPPIKFDSPFAEIGDVVSATYEQDGKTKVLKQTVGFEDAMAGNLHVNCACTYQLIIE